MLNDYKVLPDSGKVEKLVIFMHGYGADGQDLISLAEMYKSYLPNAAFHSPDAPEKTNMGIGLQWFSDNNWTFRDKEGISKAKDLIEEYIQALVEEYSLDYKDVAIVSFSQGTMTSLYSTLRFKNKIAGLVAFSGIMMWHEEFDIEKLNYNKIPVLVYHGKNDEVVPYTCSEETEKVLSNLDFPDVDLKIEEGLGHGISLQGIQKSGKFLKRVLA